MLIPGRACSATSKAAVSPRPTWGGGISVSTVFLGMDHSYSDLGPPILFETLVFGGSCDGNMDRYATWAAAEAGHAAMVEEARAALATPTPQPTEGDPR